MDNKSVTATEETVKESLNHNDIIVIDKIKKLEALLTLDEFEFSEFQEKYIYYIVDYVKRNREIRTAIFVGFKFQDVPAIIAFTSEQFREITKILK